MAHSSDSQPDMDRGRTKEFVKNDSLETLLTEVNAAIAPIMPPPYSRPRYPVVLVMGAPRCGTTLTSQWLAGSGHFAYPSNLSARFYANPYLGACIQQILADQDTGNQIGLNQPQDFASALGKTQGALAPSEYWYFWRQFFKFGEIQKMTENALVKSDTEGFLSGLAGLEAAFDSPVMLKGMIMNWHIPLLDSLLDNVLFLNLERDTFLTAQSLYFARERFFGDVERWYSFKPPEYEWLQHEGVASQLAGQVALTRKAVRNGLSGVSETRKLTLSYEEFCADPAAAYASIRKRLSAQGYDLPDAYNGVKSFKVSNRVKLGANMTRDILEALATFGDSPANPGHEAS